MQLDYLQSKFKQALYPLAEDSTYQDIYALQSGYLNASRGGVTDQFLACAGEYHARYFNYDLWRRLVQVGLEHAQSIPANPEVLDLGSGSGNSVLPILDMFKDSRVVATDISPQLLVLLRESLARFPDRLDRCGIVCGDATEAHLKENSFDIAVGTAILHHLLDPASVIRQACASVRPGGCVLFFEPFEIGAAMQRLIYDRMLADTVRLRISEAVADLLRRIVIDTTVRLGQDQTIFPHLDDKWLFTRTYFEQQARSNGVGLTIVSPHATRNAFRNQTLTYLRIVLGGDESMLSTEAWNLIRYYDEAFSEDLKSEMMIEGGWVIFKK